MDEGIDLKFWISFCIHTVHLCVMCVWERSSKNSKKMLDKYIDFWYNIPVDRIAIAGLMSDLKKELEGNRYKKFQVKKELTSKKTK